jgi:hypothetical protein
LKKSTFLVLALAASLPAAADDTRAGIQAAIVFPQNDLRTTVDGTLGLTVGVHVDIILGGGSEFRPRLDYLQCDTEPLHALTLSSTRTTAHATSLGLDYLRFFEPGSRGAYGVVGTGIQWWSASQPGFGDSHETAPFLRLGGGFRFHSDVAAEITWNLGCFRPTSGTAGSIQAGITYRF